MEGRFQTPENRPISELDALTEVSSLAGELDLKRVIHRVIEICKKASGASHASLVLLENSGVDWKHLLTARDLDPEESIRVVTAVLEHGLGGWVHRHGIPALVTDTAADERWLVFPNDPLVVRSALAVPFRYRDRTLAILTLVHPTERHFTERHSQLIAIIAGQTAAFLHNAQLFYRVENQRNQMRAILRVVPDVLFVLDETLTILLVNQAALDLLGATEEELRGRPLAEFAVREPIFEKVRGMIESNPGAVNLRLEGRSEVRKKDYVVTVTRWWDETRLDTGYAVQFADVTGFHELNRFKDEVLRMISHDLRNPLSGIMGMADLVAQEGGDEHFKESMDFILRLSNRMNGLLNDLVQVMRIRSSPLENRVELDFAELFREVSEAQVPQARLKSLRYTVSVDFPRPVRLVADSLLLRQAMENIIGNAMKYTPAGGAITVRADASERQINFRVKDSGPGIAPEDVPFLFESFFRATRVRSDSVGFGLGLSLVKNVIERHHGEVWVRSEEGQGSEFGFWIPLAPEGV